jgi:hypothetical protein
MRDRRGWTGRRLIEGVRVGCGVVCVSVYEDGLAVCS